ncbi:hypothetical protein ACTPEF_24915 [Clostridioides difficile]
MGQELESLGYKTKYGSSTWAPSTVIGIIKNEPKDIIPTVS